jgi:hypothetical protein
MYFLVLPAFIVTFIFSLVDETVGGNEDISRPLFARQPKGAPSHRAAVPVASTGVDGSQAVRAALASD